MSDVTPRISAAEYRKLVGQTAPVAPPQTKYRNKATVVDGWKFDSKLEARRYEQLVKLQQGGHVRWFLCQVPFRLPGHLIYRADFLVLWNDADTPVTIEDCKGLMTAGSKNKIKQVQEIYGIRVELITKDMVR